MMWQSFAHHNWNHQDYWKPMGTTNCPWDQAPWNVIDATIIAPTQKTVFIVIIAVIVTARHQLVTARAKNIMSIPTTTQLLDFMILKTQIMAVGTIFMLMIHGDRYGNFSVLLSIAQNKNIKPLICLSKWS